MIDLLAWTQTGLLHDMPALAKAEPKTLRYRLLHTAARLTLGGRQLRLRPGQALALGHRPRPGVHPTPADPRPYLSTGHRR